ncbi:hypothetical protein FA13DRAFT_830817 [Coprinellus micaceus]|uniref:Uncharacterized protein n=1 Tax=Coprinellus micaceus TaxID=71717 RepID=A0A4Y7T1V2_COPMI|nr:hypothetical protein FA13DRAFT_830817 [Coprinellus micaceus]
MPNNQPYTDPTATMILQIIEKASQLFTPRNRSAAGTYLAHAMDRDLFCIMLDSFETEPISPEADLDFLSSHQSAMAAMRSMSDLATVMACLDAAMPPPGCSPPDNPVLAFVNQYMEVILERWGEILRWITFFIKYVPQSLPTWDKVMHSCAQVIEFSLKNADDNPCKGEIVTLPSTIDCILLLLCLRNPSTGQPSYLRDHGNMCSICTLVCASALSEIGNASVALRLASLDSSTTIEVTKSFLERIQGVLPRTVNANTVGVAAKELTQFLTSIWTLAPKQSRRAISEATRVVSQVANGAIQGPHSLVQPYDVLRVLDRAPLPTIKKDGSHDRRGACRWAYTHHPPILASYKSIDSEKP